MATFYDESDEIKMDEFERYTTEKYGISGSVGGEVGN